MPSQSIARDWRAFPARERKQIESRMARPDGSRCPRCGDILEARPSGAAPILECRDCKRYLLRAQQTPELMYLLRIQRLATAILSA
jgi:hypothetical protein